MADDNDGSWLRGLVGELLAFLRYCEATLGDAAQREALARTLGIALGPLGAAPAPSGGDTALDRYVGGEDIDLLALLQALTERRKHLDELLVDVADEVQVLAIDLLATDYVYRHRPKLWFVMQFVGWMAETASPLGEGYTTLDRALSAVVGLLKFLFAGSGPFERLESEGDAQALSNPTLRLAAIVLAVMRIAKKGLFQDWAKQNALDMLYGWDTVPPLQAIPTPESTADLLSSRMLTVRWHARDQDDDPTSTLDASLATTFALIPEAHGGPGLFVGLSGEEDLEVELSKRLRLRFELQAAGLPLWFSANELSAAAPPGQRIALTLRSTETPDRALLFRFPDTKMLSFGVRSVALKAAVDEGGPSLDLALLGCVLSFDASTIDGFIGSLLPDRKTTVKFDIGTRYASGQGWQLTGALNDFESQKVPAPPPKPPRPAPDQPLPLLPGGEPAAKGLHRRIAVGRSLGPVRLDELLLGVDGGLDPAPHLDLSLGLSLSGHIGPVLARVDHIGLRATLTHPQDKSQANLGLVNLDLGFLAPRAIGLVVDAKSVKGGGFVFHDPDKGQYAGMLELEISQLVSVKAIGLISTRLPDGARGYSMVLLITAEGFRPIRLPMGFELAGIGGLLAIHRTVSEDALREGLRQRTLDLILFPKDPVANAAAILAGLERVFPAQRGSYVLGPMLRITWGVPVIVTMDLAVLVEWGVRDRLFVLGRISALLPREQSPLLVLRMDALGVFDLDQGTAAVDAVLVDSKLLDKFVLTGAMALRMRWRSPRSFALAVGGLHHAFAPPAGFPKLERLALNLTTGSNPRLTCEAYFALTSNTVQFGAAAHLYAEGPMSFNVTGDVGFDVLITLNPFHFLAEFLASMQIRKGTRNLFKVKVEGALEGPRPLALRAKATFEILWWDVSIRVDATLISGARPPAPPAVDVLAQLVAALTDARNWHGELAPGQSRIVVLREPGGGTASAGAPVLVHPLASLAVRQGVVPLATPQPVRRFGGAPVLGARTLAIAAVSVDGRAEPPETLTRLNEDFAPAQFFELSDAQMLASPSFVPMEAGVQLGLGTPAFRLDQAADYALEYETKVIDRSFAPDAPQRVQTLGRYTLAGAQAELHARQGAAARSTLRRAEPLRDDAAPAPRVRLAAVALPSFLAAP